MQEALTEVFLVELLVHATTGPWRPARVGCAKIVAHFIFKSGSLVICNYVHLRRFGDAPLAPLSGSRSLTNTAGWFEPARPSASITTLQSHYRSYTLTGIVGP